MSEILHTKFGNCSLNPNGHYRVTSRKEGNHSKLLHRLIWEDFYNCEIPKGFVIHHKNGVKTDNCILNLQLIRDKSHRQLHTIGKNNSNENNPMFGKCHKESSKKKMSNKKTSTGLFRVSIQNSPRMKLGYRWIYSYMENYKSSSLTSANLVDLKQKVISNGLPWEIVDKNKVKNLCETYDLNYEELV